MTRLRGEAGIGLPLAMGVLIIVLLLGGQAAQRSGLLSASSDEDRGSKRAIAASDAGLSVAAWRLRSGAVPAADCLPSNGGPVAPVAGECPTVAASENLGDGASFRYVVSPVLPAGARCAGEDVPASSNERCITSTGIAGGVLRRVQSRVVSGSYAIPTPVGVVGKTSAIFNNAIDFVTCPGDPVGTAGSNGEIRTLQTVKFQDPDCGTSSRWQLGYPSGTTVALSSGTVPTSPPVTSPAPTWDLPPIANWPLANDNANVPGGAGVTWNATTRALTVSNGTLTLPAGLYDFCSITLGSSGKLQLAGGAKATIMIDSPDRPGSTCAAGTGFLRMLDANTLNYPEGAAVKDSSVLPYARNLHLLVYGNSALETAPTFCGYAEAYGSVVMCNSASFAGTLYAPRSRVYLGNSVRFVGAVAADRTYLHNSVSFRFPSGLSATAAGTGGPYAQRDFVECTKAPTVAGDPESGCT